MNDTLQKQIDDLDPWFYDVQIGSIKVVPGIGSPHPSQQLIADTEYKRNILVDQIVSRYDFQGKSILDVASNCGYWGSYYAKNGAAKYVGLEGREVFVKQGELLWNNDQTLRDCHHRFLQTDVNSDETWEKIKQLGDFDFILLAGILYHITEHKKLLERILSITREAVLVDTRVSPNGDPKTYQFRENGNWCFDGIEIDGQKAMASHPTKESLIKFFEDHSFSVEQIRASGPVSSLMSQNDNYDLGKRITLLCRKK